MIKYAKVIDEETKICEIGSGEPEAIFYEEKIQDGENEKIIIHKVKEFYESIGMIKMNVELAYDGNWYLSEYCPHKTEEEKAREERERLDNLTRTRSEVWRALINARMFTKSDVKELIEAMPEETTEQLKAKELARVDVDDVEDFHRGHELVNMVGEYLEISSENLDNYFETGDYHYLEIDNSQE